MTDIFLRLFVEADHAGASDVAGRLLERLLQRVTSARVTAVTPYWKIPEYQEINLDVSTLDAPDEAVKAVAVLLGDGWAYQRSTEAIWNPGQLATFCERAVRWAHVEVRE